MSETLSSNAIIYAILSLNSEITLQKDYLDSPDLSPEEKENDEEILDDLEQAFMEFVDYYKGYTRKDTDLPTIEQLLSNGL